MYVKRSNYNIVLFTYLLTYLIFDQVQEHTICEKSSQCRFNEPKGQDNKLHVTPYRALVDDNLV